MTAPHHCVHTSTSARGAEALQKRAEGCQCLCKHEHNDCETSFIPFTISLQLRPHTTTRPVQRNAREAGKRCVRAEERRKRCSFQQIPAGRQTAGSLSPTRKRRTEPYCFHAVCGKAFHAPSVGQILSADPGRITEEPICVR